jgi:hypothetical protein
VKSPVSLRRQAAASLAISRKAAVGLRPEAVAARTVAKAVRFQGSHPLVWAATGSATPSEVVGEARTITARVAASREGRGALASSGRRLVGWIDRG